MNGKSAPMGQLLASLPPEQRAERYRQFANDAMKKAQDSKDPDRRAEFLTLASGWHAMAVEAERAVPSSPLNESDQPQHRTRTPN